MKLLAVALLSLALAAPAWAQTSQDAPVDPARRALAHKVIEAVHADKMVDTIQGMMQGQMANLFTANLTPEKRHEVEQFQEATSETMHSFTPRLLSFMEELYARDFSDKELTDMLAFYNSPTGQSTLAKTPMIAQQMGPFMAQQMPIIMRDVFQRYCAKATCTAEQKAAMDKLSPAASAKS